MSNFLKQGNRKASKHKRKLIRRHTKEFYKILDMMNKFAIDLLKNEETVSEDNIQELSVKYIGREIDNMEKMIILSKLEDFKITNN